MEIEKQLEAAGVPHAPYPFRASEVDDYPALGGRLGPDERVLLRGLSPSTLVLEADKASLPIPPEFRRIGQAGRFLLFVED
jgi:hypothetical protein